MLLVLVLVLSVCVVYLVIKVNRNPKSPYLNTALGVQPTVGVMESGFYNPEEAGGTRFRWTNGTAKLIVPIESRDPPKSIGVDLEVPKGFRVQLLVNGVSLFNDKLEGEWMKYFDLSAVSLKDEVLIELLSDTVIPKHKVPGSEDTRPLGVKVREIRLLRNKPV